MEHFLGGESTAWTLSVGGLVTGHGRRPWFVVLNVALVMAPALHKLRSLRRRGAEPWRRRLWFALVLALGAAGWLCCRILEPRTFPAGAIRQARSSDLLILGERVALS